MLSRRAERAAQVLISRVCEMTMVRRQDVIGPLAARTRRAGLARSRIAVALRTWGITWAEVAELMLTTETAATQMGRNKLEDRERWEEVGRACQPNL